MTCGRGGPYKPSVHIRLYDRNGLFARRRDPIASLFLHPDCTYSARVLVHLHRDRAAHFRRRQGESLGRGGKRRWGVRMGRIKYISCRWCGCGSSVRHSGIVRSQGVTLQYLYSYAIFLGTSSSVLLYAFRFSRTLRSSSIRVIHVYVFYILLKYDLIMWSHPDFKIGHKALYDRVERLQ